MKPIAKLGKESLAAAGSFAFTIIDMGVSISKGQYNGAVIDLKVGGLGFLAGALIGTTGMPVAGVILFRVGASILLDMGGSYVKEKYYRKG